jgi:Domain of unknown function (DUF222)
MSQVSSPAPGPDGDEPPSPGGAARDGTPLPGGDGDDDFDAEADLARSVAEVDSGQVPVPSEEDLRGPAVMFTLGEAADVDPVVLGKMAGPDGLGGQGFAQEQVADALRPGPLLAALTEEAARDVRVLSDDELLGMVQSARRLQNRAEYLELAGIAEFAARRQRQLEASIAREDPPGQRVGEFADAELGMELLVTGREAGDRMELAAALATRLPCTFAGLADGRVDGGKAYTVWFYTRWLSDADAAQADIILAAAAPGIRHESLARKAAALEMKLDPDAARARKEHARQDGRRVEARREASGNISFGARELAVEEGLSVKAFNDADAVALRRAGMTGSLRELRVLAFLDRICGRDPLARIGMAGEDEDDGQDEGRRGDGGPEPYDGSAHDGEDDGRWGDDDDDSAGAGHRGGAGSSPGDNPVPLPALINLLVPAATLLGWGTAPGHAGRWGLLDADDTRAMVHAASRHLRTRWCVTVTGPDGTAVAHGCARGPRPWTPPPAAGGRGGPGSGSRERDGPGRDRAGPPAEPDQHQQQARLAELLRALNITLAPIAKGGCDHRHREERYQPSRKLGHLVRARTGTCPAPGCGAQAYHADLDHTVAWPEGPSDECNLSPPCRRHHRVKQAPGWRLDQPRPGIMLWTAPSGRTYTTTPTVYEL